VTYIFLNDLSEPLAFKRSQFIVLPCLINPYFAALLAPAKASYGIDTGVTWNKNFYIFLNYTSELLVLKRANPLFCPL